MNRIFPRMLVCLAAVCFLSAPAAVFADDACYNMKINHVGISAAAPSGVEVYLTNSDTKACGPGGAILPGQTKQFYLSTTNTDKTLAIFLTAASLKKNVFVYATGSVAPYIIAFGTCKNITE